MTAVRLIVSLKNLVEVALIIGAEMAVAVGSLAVSIYACHLAFSYFLGAGFVNSLPSALACQVLSAVLWLIVGARAMDWFNKRFVSRPASV